MYLEFYGLNKSPFSITPDTQLFFEGSQRGDSLTGLCYTVANAEGITKVVGEVGTGKTMLCRMLPLKAPQNVDWVYLAHPNLCPKEVLVAIARELGGRPKADADKSQLTSAIHKKLIDRHRRGRRVVVLVDEAQAMSLESLEEIRLLSNLETDEHKLMQIVLFGQPELDKKMALAEIRQLKERVVQHIYLSPFSANEVAKYLNFRMRASGYKGPDIFNEAIADMIEQYSQGLVRRVNILADKCLLAAYVSDRHDLRIEDVKYAARESQLSIQPFSEKIKKWFARNTAHAVMCVFAGYCYYSVLGEAV